MQVCKTSNISLKKHIDISLGEVFLKCCRWDNGAIFVIVENRIVENTATEIFSGYD